MGVPHVITIPHFVVVLAIAGLLLVCGAVLADEAAVAGVDGPVQRVSRSLVAVLVYVIGPVRIWQTHRVVSPGSALPLSASDEAELPADLQRFLAGAEAGLQREGFGAPVRARIQSAARVKTVASLLEHSDHGTLASAATVQGEQGKQVCVIFLRTEFTSGPILVTTNSPQRRRFPIRPGYEVMAFPEMSEPAALYRLHRFRVAERSPATLQINTRLPDPFAYQAREMAETQDYYVRIGYYRPTDRGSLRLTAKGAVCMVWRAKFPWAQLVKWRDARARNALLARFARA